MATMLTARPSSGIGGPRRDRFRTGELTPTSMRCSEPRSIRSITHSRTSGTIRIGHIRFSADADIGVPAKPSVRRGSPEYSTLPVPATPISPLLMSRLRQQHALAVGIEAQADGDAIENQRLFVVGPGEHDGAAGKSQLPFGGAAVRRLEMGQQRDPVRPGNDLERRHQHAPSGIPFDTDIGRIDRHRIIRRIAVDDVSGAGADLAAEIGRQAVAAEFALQFAGQRQVRAVGQVLQPHRQQDIGRRDLVGADIDRSHPVGGRSDHDAKRPGAAALFAETERYPAAARPAQAEADILERPFVAALLVVDNEVAVLQADLVEVLPVEPGQAQAVEPVEAGEQSALPAIGSRRGGRGCGAGRSRRSASGRRRHRESDAEMSAPARRLFSTPRRWRAAWRCRRRKP